MPINARETVCGKTAGYLRSAIGGSSAAAYIAKYDTRMNE